MEGAGKGRRLAVMPSCVVHRYPVTVLQATAMTQPGSTRGTQGAPRSHVELHQQLSQFPGKGENTACSECSHVKALFILRAI